MFIFMYTILGMELFSHQLRFNYDGEQIEYFEGPREDTSKYFSVPLSTFDDFLSATFTVYIVLVGDGWTSVYFDHYRVVGTYISTFFFVSLIILGQLILFNLFLSILLKEFDDDLI